jgi:aspartyl-tRNA(Asn)/glutamyl-tRNA(Gln) amidotransferase subunit B
VPASGECDGREVQLRRIRSRRLRCAQAFPDLPKGYQISRRAPIVHGKVDVAGTAARTSACAPAHRAPRRARYRRHRSAGSCRPTFLAAEAGAYMRKVHALVRYLEICDGNMQEGSFRCDANVSVRRRGETKLGVRTELKNLNSFKFVEKAIEIEAARQIELIENGGKVVQETRLYDPDRNETRPMRSKEEANDYRYFPDPDLLPVSIDEQLVAQVRASLPELPDAKRERFMRDYALPAYDAGVLTVERALADYFEAVAKATKATPKIAANWVIGELTGALNREGLEVRAARVSAAALASLLDKIASPAPREPIFRTDNRRSDSIISVSRRLAKTTSRTVAGARFPARS